MAVSVYKQSSRHQACSTNIFDNLPCLNKFKPVCECDELKSYLATGMEDVTPGDVLKWWHDQHSKYPQLSHMVLDYLTIPGTSHFFYSFVMLMQCTCSYICRCGAALQQGLHGPSIFVQSSISPVLSHLVVSWPMEQTWPCQGQ